MKRQAWEDGMTATTAGRRTAPKTITIVTDKEAELERIERFATLLDSQFTIPGTDVKFGIEAIVGLFPVVGDLIGFICSAVIYHQLKQLDLPRWTRVRMGWNIAIDTLAGIIPIVGDIFDVAYKANTKNIALARRALAKERKRIR
jgi:hypothetical protein